MEIVTERLCIKPLGVEYLASTAAYACDIENARYMQYLPNETLEETKKFLICAEQEWQKETPAYYEFAILLEGVHIGAISIYLEEESGAGELGWILHKNYWGCGYATEAAEAIIAYGVRELGVHHFIAHCDSENLASAQVMEKIGMHLTDDRRIRKNRISDEERKEYRYEMLR